MYKGQVVTGIIQAIGSMFAYAANVYLGLVLHLLVVLHAALANPRKKVAAGPPPKRISKGVFVGGLVVAGLLVAVAISLEVQSRSGQAPTDTTPLPPVSEESATLERIEAQQRDMEKRATIERLRKGVAELVDADRSFRTRMEEEKAKIDENIKRLGGPDSDLGRPAAKLAASRGKSAVSAWEATTRAKADAMRRGVDAALLQDLAFADEVESTLAPLKELDVPYDTTEIVDAEPTPPAVEATPKTDMDAEAEAKAEFVSSYQEYIAAGNVYKDWLEARSRESKANVRLRNAAEETLTALIGLHRTNRLDKSSVLGVLRRKDPSFTIKSLSEVMKVAPELLIVSGEEIQVIGGLANSGKYKEALSRCITVSDLYARCMELVKGEEEYRMFQQYQ